MSAKAQANDSGTVPIEDIAEGDVFSTGYGQENTWRVADIYLGDPAEDQFIARVERKSTAHLGYRDKEFTLSVGLNGKPNQITTRVMGEETIVETDIGEVYVDAE